jgi:hypothetical protein
LMTWLDVINYCFFWLGLLNLSWAGKSIFKSCRYSNIQNPEKMESFKRLTGPLRHTTTPSDFFRPSNFQGCAHRPKSHETIALSDLSQLTSR